jgi:hypothetical protein
MVAQVSHLQSQAQLLHMLVVAEVEFLVRHQLAVLEA